MSALKRYFETHLALKADQMRRAQEVSVSSHFSRNKAIRLSGWDFVKKISHSHRSSTFCVSFFRESKFERMREFFSQNPCFSHANC